MRSSGGRQTYAAVFAMDLRSGERFKTSSGFAVYVCASADMFGVTYYYEGDEHRKPNTLSPYALVFPIIKRVWYGFLTGRSTNGRDSSNPPATTTYASDTQHTK